MVKYIWCYNLILFKIKKKNKSDFFLLLFFFSCNFEGFYQANNLTLNFMHEQERTIFVFF